MAKRCLFSCASRSQEANRRKGLRCAVGTRPWQAKHVRDGQPVGGEGLVLDQGVLRRGKVHQGTPRYTKVHQGEEGDPWLVRPGPTRARGDPQHSHEEDRIIGEAEALHRVHDTTHGRDARVLTVQVLSPSVLAEHHLHEEEAPAALRETGPGRAVSGRWVRGLQKSGRRWDYQEEPG
jgi:hypothetical protein